MKFMKAALGLALVVGAGASQAQMSSMAPCPLGMFLTMLYPSMVPSCEGTPIQGVASSAMGSIASAAGGAIQGALGGSAPAPSAQQAAALSSQAAEWGGSNNFGSVSGFGGITVKVISCDELAQMSPGMVNPQNDALGYEDLAAQNLVGQGEVQNGWWAQKLDYRTFPAGLPASGYGGAVVEYASLKTVDGGSMNQKARVIASGSCERKIAPYNGGAAAGTDWGSSAGSN